MSEAHPDTGQTPDLAAVASAMAAMDARLDAAEGVQPPPGEAQAEAAPAVDRGAELGAMLTLGVTMAAPALPFLPACYTPEVCQQIGHAFSAVADKHGWNLGGMDSPELALALVSVPPTLAAIKLGRDHFAVKRMEAEARADAARRGQVIDAPPAVVHTSGHAGTVIQPGAYQPGVSGPG